jgi:glycosyltransferase involved in cell wall biosynthesis
VYVAGQSPRRRRRAGPARRFVTACSDDLARRAVALGADPARLETVPYGVDVERFHPDPSARETVRAEAAAARGVPLVFSAGRLVRKKGFEYLIDAMRLVPGAVLALAGDGTLAPTSQRARRGAWGTRPLSRDPQDRWRPTWPPTSSPCLVRDDAATRMACSTWCSRHSHPGRRW